MPRIMYAFQKEALNHLYNRPFFGLFWEMRLGKTLVTIRRLRRCLGPFLVVAPNDALLSWEKELTLEREPFIRLAGTRKQRQSILTGSMQDFFHLNRPRYFLVNKEGHLSLPELADVRWEALILDESTFIKNPKAKVTKFFTRNFRAVPIRIILTGTPAPESPLNYVSQFLFLNPEWIGVKNYWEFRARFCRPYGFDWKPTKKGHAILDSAVSRCQALKRTDVGLDRRKIYTLRNVELPPALRRAYKGIVKDFIFDYEDFHAETKLAVQAFTWLRQLALGLVNDKLVWDGRTKVITELLAVELKGEPTIIWTNLVQENIMLTAAITQHWRAASISGATPVKERAIILQDFDAGKLDHLVVQVPCATFGLNLSRASTAIYHSCPFGLLARKQSEDRILNVRGSGPLLYIDIVTENTIDEDILEGIAKKQSEQEVKSTITRRLHANYTLQHGKAHRD